MAFLWLQFGFICPGFEIFAQVMSVVIPTQVTVMESPKPPPTTTTISFVHEDYVSGRQ